MKRRARLTILVAGMAVALIAAAPLLLRMLPFFEVRRLEFVGVELLDPERVVEALALAPDQNLFDPVGRAQQRVAGLAGVMSARVDRRLPGTLRVAVVERTPIAFVAGADGMIALDCVGHPLPYDPARSGLDLPLVAKADTVLVGTLCAVRASDSTLYQQIDITRYREDGVVALEVGPHAILLRGVPTTSEIRDVEAVRRHLLATGERFAELDARFDGWVVARRSRT